MTGGALYWHKRYTAPFAVCIDTGFKNEKVQHSQIIQQHIIATDDRFNLLNNSWS